MRTGKSAESQGERTLPPADCCSGFGHKRKCRGDEERAYERPISAPFQRFLPAAPGPALD